MLYVEEVIRFILGACEQYGNLEAGSTERPGDGRIGWRRHPFVMSAIPPVGAF
jgi:hypothetical protein